MSVRPARPSCLPADRERPATASASPPAGRLDPSVDFERYRTAACERFVAGARARGFHAFHDLEDRAQEFYSEFWVEWLERGCRELNGPAVPYIANAMLNKLRDLSRRGRSVRAPDLVCSENAEILSTIASNELSPEEQAVLIEQLWRVSDVVHSLPRREQVAFLAVFSRDSKRKDAPPAGYKLAAAQLGTSEVRAKKLALRANKRIRDAVERIEAGTWCDRWTSAIEQVAGGGDAGTEFARHAEHCLHCRLGIVQLRRQAALLPAPMIALAGAAHAGVLTRAGRHTREAWRSARHQLTNLLARHGPAVGDPSSLVGGGGVAGASGLAIKVGAVCLVAGVAGGAASVCLKAAGVPSPVIEALSGSQHHRATHRHPAKVTVHVARAASAAAIITLPSHPTVAAKASAGTGGNPGGASRSTAPQPSAAQRALAQEQKEFNPGGGCSGCVSTASAGSDAKTASAASSSSAGSSVSPVAGSGSGAGSGAATDSSSPSDTKRSSDTSSSQGTVTTGQSNAFDAP